MAKKKELKKGVRLGLESQDDIGYLTGRHSEEQEEKQIRTPAPRRSNRASKSRREKDKEGD